MARIDTLINEISDSKLRNSIQEEISKIKSKKKFGLVFEDHLPELIPIYSHDIKVGARVSKKDKHLNDTYLIKAINKYHAVCIHEINGTKTEFPIDELVVVKKFGEPIFPTLRPIDTISRSEQKSSNILIEADNYHALQLLEWIYPGKIDCIYIDPPYNSGARDWKYNNDYVDKNDTWRHSKWLSMIERRLKLAKRLLNPKNGVLIVTIDEHEMHHLRILLDQLFPSSFKQIISIVINPKGNAQGRFARVEEYAIYVFMKDAYVIGTGDDLLSRNQERNSRPRWKGLLRSGTEPFREDRESMFYPIAVDPSRNAVVAVGDPLPLDQEPDFDMKINGFPVAWPVRNDKRFGRWSIGADTCKMLIKKGYVSLGRFDKKRNTWGISYISQVLQKQIETGKIEIVSRDPISNVVAIEFAESRTRAIKTVWHRTKHDAGAYGSELLTKILGQSGAFAFPKSVYAVADSLRPVIAEKPNALILDFFAGSGTTLNAVNLLNAENNLNLSCIQVTNNEVSEKEAKSLFQKGFHPGDPEYELHGICQSVTFPRCKYVMNGMRDDGSVLDGEFLMGRTKEKVINRSITALQFTSRKQLIIYDDEFDELKDKERKSLVRSTKNAKASLIGSLGLTKSKMDKISSFWQIEPEKKSAILFDSSHFVKFLDSLLENAEYIQFIYIVSLENADFKKMKKELEEVLPPFTELEEERRPMKIGFDENLHYFRLDFLDPEDVEMGASFTDLLPTLWLMAGGKGPLPVATGEEDWLIPEGCSFAILLNETKYGSFLEKLYNTSNIDMVFIVTDSRDAFVEMNQQLPDVIPMKNRIHLYRNYIDNFQINRGEY